MLNTAGSIIIPFLGTEKDITKTRGTLLQTTGSKTTQGAFAIFESATSTDDFQLIALNISIVNPTAATLFKAYMGTDQIMELATGTAGYWATFFGDYGLRGGTTTTATVSAITSGGTCTVIFVATGIRRS